MVLFILKVLLEYSIYNKFLNFNIFLLFHIKMLTFFLHDDNI
nr:MAG TPA: hypothetical protein [Caudoviricetes sp.]